MAGFVPWGAPNNGAYVTTRTPAGQLIALTPGNSTASAQGMGDGSGSMYQMQANTALMASASLQQQQQHIQLSAFLNAAATPAQVHWAPQMVVQQPASMASGSGGAFSSLMADLESSLGALAGAQQTNYQTALAAQHAVAAAQAAQNAVAAQMLFAHHEQQPGFPLPGHASGLAAYLAPLEQVGGQKRDGKRAPEEEEEELGGRKIQKMEDMATEGLASLAAMAVGNGPPESSVGGTKPSKDLVAPKQKKLVTPPPPEHHVTHISWRL
jgi:hypothetical protein